MPIICGFWVGKVHQLSDSSCSDLVRPLVRPRTLMHKIQLVLCERFRDLLLVLSVTQLCRCRRFGIL